jgi:hypothetical protein
VQKIPSAIETTIDRLCEGFRMPALHGRLPPGVGGAGVRKPPKKETASWKGGVAAARYGELSVAGVC